MATLDVAALKLGIAVETIAQVHEACDCRELSIWGTHSLSMLAATWKGRAVAVKVMLASHGEHASELESFRQEVRPSCSDTLVTIL